MKRIFKLITLSVSIIAIFCSCFVTNVSAANATIDFGGKSTVTVGNDVTVKVTITGSNMTGADFSVTYDPAILQYVSGADSGGAGSLHIVDSSMEELKSKTYTLKFTAIKAGRCVVAVSGSKSDGIPASDIEVSASATITANDPVLSSNANLKSLTVSGGSLSPKFSASTTSYSVSVKNSVTECTISATPSDSDATVALSQSNPVKLNVGSNTCKVTVTAPNGSQKTYTVVINRSEKTEEQEDEEEPTSSEETTSEPEDTDKNPLETTIDGTDYIVATDISSVKLFNGFSAETTEYNGTTVAVAKDLEGEYEIYYLGTADGNALTPYIYDTESGVFNKLAYFTQGDYTYIFAELPEENAIDDGYYTTNIKISEFDVRCFANSSDVMSDFYYLYCYNDGVYGFYRYDSRENVLQRYPEFVLTSASDTPVDNSENSGFLARFESLSSNAKTVVLCLVLLALGAIALIVLLIIKLVRNKENDDYEDFDDDFDSFSVVNNSDIPAETDETPEE